MSIDSRSPGASQSPIDHFSGAARLVSAIRNGETSSRELLEVFLARIERFNPSINAVVTLDADRARSDADSADAAINAGGPVGPLHGLSVTVKDCLATAGIRTTCGTTALAEYVPAADATVVARLRVCGGNRRRKPTCRRMQETRNPITISSGQRTTLGTSLAPRAARPADRRRR